MTEKIEWEPGVDSPEQEPKKIVLVAGNSKATVLHEGALVADFQVNGVNVFMPDQEYDVKGKRKRRGGVPYLNYAGPQHKKQRIFDLQLDQHGFARDQRWSVKDQANNSVTMSLTDNEETHRQLPYAFNTDMTITLDEGRIKWDWTTTNNGKLKETMNDDMPAADALHPYVEIEDHLKTRIETNIPDFDPATHDWNDPQQQIKKIPDNGEVKITIPGKGTLTMRASEQFSKLVLWTEDGKPHICFEPWVGGLYAVLDREQRVTIPEGEDENFWVEISFQPETEQ